MFEVAELMERSEEPPQQSTTEEPPHRRSSQQSRRAPIWADVPDAQWNDWRWQLSRRLNLLEENYRLIGVAIGTHPTWKHVCVMDFMDAFKK